MAVITKDGSVSFHPNDEGKELSLRTAVGQALGFASVCWSNPRGAGEFDSAKCSKMANALLAHITRQALPNLGLATTREILKELEVRLEMGGGLMRPVGSAATQSSGRAEAALHHVRRAYATLSDTQLDYSTAGDNHG